MTGFFTNKKILITGGTGSIGMALVEKLKNEQPSEIRIFSNDEYSLFKLRNENAPIKLIVGDVTNYSEIEKAVKGCDIVFHAAALKHITMCETNPSMALHVNVTGTQNVIRSCIDEVDVLVNISTDKAVNPVSTLGATKLLGEKLISSSDLSTKKTKCWSVRFGNVMGSRGSVYEAFMHQLKNNQNLQLTDKKMTRFIMSVNDAANLVLQTCAFAQGGEVFVLKMPVIRIKDLAEVMNKIYSETENTELKEIEETGIREAEKLYEELMTDSESELSFENKKLFLINSPFQNHQYPNFTKTNIQHYRSMDLEPLTHDEIKNILNQYFEQ